MSRYREQAPVDPRELEPGDLVGFSNAGPRLAVIVGSDPQEDPFWLTLVNDPRSTTGVPEHGGIRPLPHGNVAMDLADYGWFWGVYPRVLARRLVRPAVLAA